MPETMHNGNMYNNTIGNNNMMPNSNMPGNMPNNNMPNNMPGNMPNNNMSGGMSKDALMKQICIAEFVIGDLNLYLDTHPMDQNAMNMYHDQNAKLKMMRAQYASAYGPQNIYEVTDRNFWTWVKEPWPWEMGREV